MIYVMFQLLEKVVFIFHLESIVRLIVNLNSCSNMVLDGPRSNQTYSNVKVLIYDT